MARSPTSKSPKQVETFTHKEATRLNNPTAELGAFLDPEQDAREFGPTKFKRARPLPEGETRERDKSLDPQIVWNGARIRLTPDQVQALVETGEAHIGDAQLVWRGKDRQDWSDLIVEAPPIYVQEKVHPKAIIDDLKRETSRARDAEAPDLFADFNGIDPEARTEFYQHPQHWSNRMILGDSLQVMASLAEREGLRGKVQAIYFDPPYGIKFNSNWQVSTLSRDVKDGKREDMSREPEQVKAFRDTWRDGIHSYLTYLRDRLTIARELLTESGSVFVQIGDENVHRVRAVMDEVFGAENLIAEIVVQKAGSTYSEYLGSVADYIIWMARDRDSLKYREVYQARRLTEEDAGRFSMIQFGDGRRQSAAKAGAQARLGRRYAPDPLESAGMGRQKGEGAASWFEVPLAGKSYTPTAQTRWKTNRSGMQ